MAQVRGDRCATPERPRQLSAPAVGAHHSHQRISSFGMWLGCQSKARMHFNGPRLFQVISEAAQEPFETMQSAPTWSNNFVKIYIERFSPKMLSKTCSLQKDIVPRLQRVRGGSCALAACRASFPWHGARSVLWPVNCL